MKAYNCVIRVIEALRTSNIFSENWDMNKKNDVPLLTIVVLVQDTGRRPGDTYPFKTPKIKKSNCSVSTS